MSYGHVVSNGIKIVSKVQIEPKYELYFLSLTIKLVFKYISENVSTELLNLVCYENTNSHCFMLEFYWEIF